MSKRYKGEPESGRQHVGPGRGAARGAYAQGTRPSYTPARRTSPPAPPTTPASRVSEGGPIPKRDQPTRSDASSTSDGGPLLTPLRELQLVEAYRAGDPEAIGTLLRAYQRRMFSVCYRMLRNDEEARDLTQEAMVKVLEGLPSFDARARLSTWIIRVTMNCCLSYLRKRKLRRHASIDAPPASVGPGMREGSQPLGGSGMLVDPGEPGPDRRVELGEQREALMRGLDVLDPQMRAILILRDMHDLDYLQIAEVLDKPVGTIKSRLFRARLALRQAMEGKPPEAPTDDAD